MSIKSELETIYNKHGILKPIDVIEHAKDKNTTLHNCFEWNNKKAGDEHRLWQARQLIVRVSIEMPEKENETIQAYVSLSDDRKTETGYRHIIDVMSDKERRQQLLDQAVKELEYFEIKYKMLEELEDIFKAKRNIKKKVVA